MKISFWIDFNCPFSYIGFMRLNRITEKLNYSDIKYDAHSFEIDYQENETYADNLNNKYDKNHEIVKKEKKIISNLVAEELLELDLDSTKLTNSRKAHRILKLAIQYNNQFILKKYIQNIFEGRFIEKEDINDNRILLKIAIQSGLEKDDVKDVLESDKFDSEVILDERVAADTNIQGVPYFIFNNKYPLPGILPENELINVLKKVNFEEELSRKINIEEK